MQSPPAARLPHRPQAHLSLNPTLVQGSNSPDMMHTYAGNASLLTPSATRAPPAPHLHGRPVLDVAPRLALTHPSTPMGRPGGSPAFPKVSSPAPTLHTPTQPPQTAPTQAFPMHPADHLSGNGSPLVKHLPHSPHSGGAQSMSFPVPLHVTEPHPSSPLSLHPSTHTLAQPFSPEPKTPLGRPGPPTPTHTPTHPQPHPQLSVSHTESEESIPGASLASHTPRDADSHHPNGTSHTRGHTQVTTGTTSLEEEAPTAGSPLRTKANSLLSEEVESQAEHTLFPFPSHQSGAQGLMSPWNTQEPAGPSTVTVSAPGVRAAAVRTPSLGRLSVNQTAWSSSGSASASGTDGALQTPSPALGTPVGPGPRTVAPLGRSTVSPSGMGVGTHAPLPPPTDPVSPDPRTPLGRPAAPSFGHPLASGAQDPLHPSPASPDRKPPVGRQQPVAANAGSADLPSVHGERDSSESTSIAAGVPIRVPPTVEHSGDPPPSENASVVSQPLTIHPALTGRAPPPTRSMSAAAAAPAPTPTPVAVPLQVTEERTPRMMDSSLSIRVTATSDGGASLSQHDAAVMEPNEQTQDRSTLHLASPDPHTPLSRPAMVGQPQGPMTSPDPRTPLGRPAGLLQGSAVPTMSSPEPRTPGAPSMGQAQRGAVPTMSSPEPRTPLGRPGAPSMGHPQGRAQPLSVHMACPEPRPPLGPGAPSMGQPQDSALHVSSPLVHPTVEPQQGSTRPASGLLSSPELHTPLGRSGPQASVHASASFMSSPEPRTPLGRPDAPSMGQPQANAVLLPVVSSSDPQTPPRSELVSSSACAQAQQSMSVASTSPDVTQAQSMSSPDVTRGSARPLAVGVGPRAGSDTGVSRSGAHIAQESNSMGTPHGTRSPVSSPYGPPQPFSVIGTLSPAVASPSHTQAPFMGHHLPTTEPGQSSEMHLHPESSPHLSIHVPGSEQPRPRTPLSRPDPLLRNGGSPWIGTPEQGQEGVGSQLQGNRIGSSPRGDLNEAGQEVVVGHGEGRYRVRSPKAGSSGNLYTPQSTSFNESQTAFFSPQPPHISPQRSGDALGKSSSVHRMIGNQVSPSNSSGHQNAAKFPVMSRTPFREESIASLRSANESLKTELQRSVDQCQTLIGERDLLMQQKSELEQQLTLIREQHGDSSTAIHTLTSRCTQLTAQISMLQNEITELNRTHQRQHDEFQGVVQQACQESELLQHQKAHLESLLATAQKDLLSLHAENQSLHQTHTDYQAHLAQMDTVMQEKAELENRCETIQRECNGLNGEKQALEKRCWDSERRCGEMQRERGQLEERMNELRDLPTHTKLLESQVEQLTHQNASQRNAANSERQTLHTSLSRLVAERHRLTQQVTQYKAHITHLEKEVQAFKEKCRETESLRSTLVAKDDTTTGLRRDLIRLRDERRDLRSKLSKAKESASHQAIEFQAELAAAGSTLHRLHTTQQHTQSEAEDLRNLLAEREMTLQEMTERMDVMETVCDEKDRLLHAASAKVARLEENLRSMFINVRQCQQELDYYRKQPGMSTPPVVGPRVDLYSELTALMKRAQFAEMANRLKGEKITEMESRIQHHKTHRNSPTSPLRTPTHTSTSTPTPHTHTHAQSRRVSPTRTPTGKHAHTHTHTHRSPLRSPYRN